MMVRGYGEVIGVFGISFGNAQVLLLEPSQAVGYEEVWRVEHPDWESDLILNHLKNN